MIGTDMSTSMWRTTLPLIQELYRNEEATHFASIWASMSCVVREVSPVSLTSCITTMATELLRMLPSVPVFATPDIQVLRRRLQISIMTDGPISLLRMISLPIFCFTTITTARFRKYVCYLAFFCTTNCGISRTW